MTYILVLMCHVKRVYRKLNDVDFQCKHKVKYTPNVNIMGGRTN